MTLKVGDYVWAPFTVHIILDHKLDKYLVRSLVSNYECWTHLSPRLKLTPEEMREAKAFYL